MINNSEQFIKEVGNRIRAYRLEQKMTLLDLAIKAEMEENALQRIEKGRTNPTVKTLVKVANALKIDVADLFNVNQENINH